MLKSEVIGSATLYCGDCREVISGLARVDATVTDPPYGVGVEYGEFIDTPENVRELVGSVIPQCIGTSKRVVLSCATRQQHFYPPPTWVLCWLNRAGTYANPWGFTCWQPIMVYGPDPFLEKGLGGRPDVIEHCETVEQNGHPVPKPIRFWTRLLGRTTAPEDMVILDPFMGSGTTGVAAINLGRKFIGIELESKYFDIACRRIEEEQKQIRLFGQDNQWAERKSQMALWGRG